MKIVNYIVLGLLISTNCLAVTFEKDNLKLNVNGYIGYKYVIASEQHSTIHSEPELGLMLSLQLHDYLSIYTQFKYDENINNALVYSFASFDYPLSEELSISLKAGKLRNNIALYNELRINPRTRPQVIMPQAIYWNNLGTILTSGVGVRLDVKWKNLEVSYSIEEPIITDSKSDAKAWAGALISETSTKFGDSQVAYVKYSGDDIPITIKSSWTRFNLGNNYTPAYQFLFPSDYQRDNIFHLFNNSLQYTLWNKLTLTGEHLFVKGTLNQWDEPKNWSYGWSVSAKYEVTDNISIYTNYNEYISKISKLNSMIKTPSNLATTSDINGGINYHRDDWQIGVEAHHIHGARWMNSDDYKSDPSGYENWWMVGMNFVYFF